MRLAAWHQHNDAFLATADDWTVNVFPSQGHAMVRFDTHVSHPPSMLPAVSSRLAATFSVRPHPKHRFRPEEIYVRQTDLIARYSQSEEDQFAFQFDWRLKPAQPPFALALEIWISIQTQLLDTHPKFQLQCVGPGAWAGWSPSELDSGLGLASRREIHGNSNSGLKYSGEVKVAWLSTAGQQNFVWLTDPRDQAQVHWMNTDSRQALKAELFGDFLEKGVIRRARMQLLVGSAPVLQEDVERVFRDLDASALPLTA